MGAGVGGLVAAAVLARQGLDVTVLENHVYPGGCAGTFYHRGFMFDAGATVAGGFYPGGPMQWVAQAAGIADWGGRPELRAMDVLLPGNSTIVRYGDDRRWDERRRWFGESGLDFWRWQERVADDLWAFATGTPPWPPQTRREAGRLAGQVALWLARDPRRMGLFARSSSTVSSRLPADNHLLRSFVDAQLLISSQTTCEHTNALFGAAALDLPRREVRHFAGGMGAIAQRLAEAVVAGGGRVLYKKRGSRIRFEGGRPVAVETLRRGRKGAFDADIVVANLTPGSLAPMFDDPPIALKRLAERRGADYGAFVVHAGVVEDVVPVDAPLHRQVVVRNPLREGNSAFVSVSPSWDATRAPTGRRAITISTHTELGPWWELRLKDAEGYERMKQRYSQRLLEAASVAVPGIREATTLVLPGTPVTYNRFTLRSNGWVGGYPQESLFAAVGPRVANGVWMVGDTVFPGQSTAAVAMGGLRTARAILDDVA